MQPTLEEFMLEIRICEIKEEAMSPTAIVRDFDMPIQGFLRNSGPSLFPLHEHQFLAPSDETERTAPQVRIK